jgi:hypothetical protein
MEFYNTAMELRKEITRLCLNEKYFPKRSRNFYALPIFTLAQAMTQNRFQKKHQLRDKKKVKALGQDDKY